MELTAELKAERRAILLDMQKQIMDEHIHTARGFYLCGIDYIFEEIKLSEDISMATSCQPYVDRIAQYCEVCFRGGLLLSVIRRHNKVTFRELIFDTDDPILVAGWFSRNECFLMENAYERKCISDCDEGMPVEAAIRFGKQFLDDDQRMLAIIDNCLAHDTIFTPDEE